MVNVAEGLCIHWVNVAGSNLYRGLKYLKPNKILDLGTVGCGYINTMKTTYINAALIPYQAFSKYKFTSKQRKAVN